MIAKVIWNMKYTTSGTVPARVSVPAPPRNARPSPPMTALPGSNTRLYATASQSTETRQQIEKQCISTDSRLRARTSPP